MNFNQEMSSIVIYGGRSSDAETDEILNDVNILKLSNLTWVRVMMNKIVR